MLIYLPEFHSSHYFHKHKPSFLPIFISQLVILQFQLKIISSTFKEHQPFNIQIQVLFEYRFYLGLKMSFVFFESIISMEGVNELDSSSKNQISELNESRVSLRRESREEEQVDPFSKKMYYVEKDYLLTRSMNLIGKKCLIRGSNNIEIFDHAILMQRTILRGDLAKISIGRCTILGESIVIKPGSKRANGQIKYIPIQVGEYVFIDKNTIIQAMKIGNCVKIGKECTLGPRVVIGDNSIILDGTIIPPDSYIASYSVYGGKPALYLGQLPESFAVIQKEACTAFFGNFVKKN